MFLASRIGLHLRRYIQGGCAAHSHVGIRVSAKSPTLHEVTGPPSISGHLLYLTLPLYPHSEIFPIRLIWNFSVARPSLSLGSSDVGKRPSLESVSSIQVGNRTVPPTAPALLDLEEHGASPVIFACPSSLLGAVLTLRVIPASPLRRSTPPPPPVELL